MIIGIDPGLTGAIAFNDQVFDLPVMAKGKGASRVKGQINTSALYALIEDHTNDGFSRLKSKVYLERVSSMPGQGVAGVFSLGDTYGCIRGVCSGMGIPIEIITPQSWKKHFKLGKDKEIVRAKAIELFPYAPLARKKDHNRAEALLIAKYGHEKELE